MRLMRLADAEKRAVKAAFFRLPPLSVAAADYDARRPHIGLNKANRLFNTTRLVLFYRLFSHRRIHAQRLPLSRRSLLYIFTHDDT